MNIYTSLVFGALLCGCSLPPRTQVQIIDKRGHPVEGFPIRFELGEGMTQTDFATPISQPLIKVDNMTFEAKTNVNGVTGISYYFDDRQPSDWRVFLLNAKMLPSRHVQIIPLNNIPKGTRIKVGIPNP